MSAEEVQQTEADVRDLMGRVNNIVGCVTDFNERRQVIKSIALFSLKCPSHYTDGITGQRITNMIAYIETNY